MKILVGYKDSKTAKDIMEMAYKHGSAFKADVYISNIIKTDQIEIAIQSLDGKKIQSFTSKPKGSVTRVGSKVSDVVSWNPERPQMYRALFRLKSAGRTIHQHVEMFGFRTVEVRENDGIYVNDVRI